MWSKHTFLTYHNGAWVLQRPGWRLNEVAEPLAAVVEKCSADKYVAAIQKKVAQDTERVVDDFNVEEWSVAFEVCPETMREQFLVRLHVHLVLSWPKQKCVRSRDSLCLAGVPPTHCGGGHRGQTFHRSRQTGRRTITYRCRRLGVFGMRRTRLRSGSFL